MSRKITYSELTSLTFIMISPILHLLRFKGRLRTPLGVVRIDNDDVLREFVYALFKTKFRYMRTIASIPFLTSSDSTIVDVGANIGDFTMAFSPNVGAIIALEPGRNTFATLCENVRANSLTNVIPLNVGAHDSVERLDFDGHYLDLRVSPNGHEHAPGVPLDFVLSKFALSRVDILKIDAQGHEARVLKGVIRSLEGGNVGLAIVEIHPARGVLPQDVISFMKSYGFRPIAKDNGPFQPQLYFTNS